MLRMPSAMGEGRSAATRYIRSPLAPIGGEGSGVRGHGPELTVPNAYGKLHERATKYGDNFRPLSAICVAARSSGDGRARP